MRGGRHREIGAVLARGDVAGEIGASHDARISTLEPSSNEGSRKVLRPDGLPVSVGEELRGAQIGFHQHHPAIISYMYHRMYACRVTGF